MTEVSNEPTQPSIDKRLYPLLQDISDEIYKPEPIKGTVFYPYTHDSVHAVAEKISFMKWECDCYNQINDNCALHGWGKFVRWCCGHLYVCSNTCLFTTTKHTAMNHVDLIHSGILSEPKWYSDSELDLDGFPVLELLSLET